MAIEITIRNVVRTLLVTYKLSRVLIKTFNLGARDV